MAVERPPSGQAPRQTGKAAGRERGMAGELRPIARSSPAGRTRQQY